MGQTEGQWIPGPGGSIHSLRIHPFQSTGITLTLIPTNWFMKGVCLSQPVFTSSQSPSHRPTCGYCSASWVEVPDESGVGLGGSFFFFSVQEHLSNVAIAGQLLVSPKCS